MTYFGGKEKHQWTSYFIITEEKINKSNKGAICKACYNAMASFMTIKPFTNKRETCRRHLKKCIHFKVQLNEESWKEIEKKIEDEEKNDKNNRNIKKRKIVEISEGI
jgi:hypothetical protein